jgi:hypothetical protein
MYLKQMRSGDLVEVIDLTAVFDPCAASIRGRIHAGEELQDPADFSKSELVFPSGEALPRCWLDPDYRGQLRIA